MRRSAKFVEKQTDLKNEYQEEQKAKKNRSDDRITINATLDNGTLVEVFKSLSYCQLAKNSLVSKKFWNVIQINRHRLALLYVDSIRMVKVQSSRACVQVFNRQISTEEYNEWVIRNNYSKQIPLQGQSMQHERKFYELCVDDLYSKDRSHRQCDDIKNVFFTCKELNHENWPLFEHFVRLITDPFIYICSLEMAYQTDVLCLLASSISPDRNRLRCEKFKVNPEFGTQKEMGWIKDHVLCNTFQIYDDGNSNFDEELLDFVITGASCTSEMSLRYYDLSNVILDFVQKFKDLKSFDENQIVRSIKSNYAHMVIEVMKRNYAEFIVKEDEDEEGETALIIFQVINMDIGKKMQIGLETTDCSKDYIETYFSLEIENLYYLCV